MTRWMTVGMFVLACVTAGCAREASRPEPEVRTLNVTHWTDKTELFMEYQPLVAGQTAVFAVHLTTIDDFKAVNVGHASIEFAPESGGAQSRLVGPAPSRPGVFRVEGALPAPGRYQWALSLDAPGVTDRHDLGAVTVFADPSAARADAEQHSADDPSAISYLKEPQWTTDFATVPVQEAEVRRSIRVPATIHALPGGAALVAAPAAGRFTAEAVVSIGDRVKAGQSLGRLEPRLAAGADRATLEAEVAEARSALEAARSEQMRAERLLEDQAVPARRVEDARRAVGVAEARRRAAEARLAQRDETLRTGGGGAAGNAFALPAPIGGRVAEVMATRGASYDEGATLFRIVRTDRVTLELQVAAADVGAARNTAGLALEIPGRDEPLVLQPHHIRHPGVVDPATRALPLHMEIDNPGEQLLVGQVVTAVLYSRERSRVPTVPSAAVLMEAGRPYVFVQLGGETFARRFIEISSRDGDLVGIRAGVRPGERVVTRGAYDVQLASAARGLPAEGHVH